MPILDGIRVLDFGRYLAGPYAAQLLGLLGAEVIRIERRDGGEDRFIQPLGPGPNGGQARESAIMHHTAAGKRSMTLDPGKPGARAILARLIPTADVVVANLPPAGLRAMGLDYPSLVALRPDIILVTQNGFGSEGADADRPGFDGIGQAMSGGMWFTGQPGQPVKAAAPYVDFSTALASAFGALAALMERQQSGRGQIVEASLVRTAQAAFGVFLTEEASLGIGRVPSGNRVQTSAPSDCFACADGHILVHTVGTGLFRRLARLIGRDDWLDDPALLTDEGRGAQGDRLCAALATWLADKPRAEAIAALGGAGVPAGAVLSVAEAAAYGQAAGWLCPTGDGGAPAFGLPLSLSVSGPDATPPPPALGADTGPILADLGFSAAEIAGFRADGVV